MAREINPNFLWTSKVCNIIVWLYEDLGIYNFSSFVLIKLDDYDNTTKIKPFLLGVYLRTFCALVEEIQRRCLYSVYC